MCDTMTSSFLLRMNNTNLILDFLAPYVHEDDLSYLKSNLPHLKKFKNFILNMNKVSEINNNILSEFETLKDDLPFEKISFYGLSPILNTVFYRFNLDKKYQIYMSEEDAINDKNPIIKRRLKVV